jgi:hypothetical protein
VTEYLRDSLKETGTEGRNIVAFEDQGTDLRLCEYHDQGRCVVKGSYRRARGLSRGWSFSESYAITTW